MPRKTTKTRRLAKLHGFAKLRDAQEDPKTRGHTKLHGFAKFRDAQEDSTKRASTQNYMVS